MPRGKLRPTLEEVKALLGEDRDFLRPLVQVVLQELLEAEMTEALGAEKGERTPLRLGHAAATTVAPCSPGSASWSCASRRTAPVASRPSCSSATSARTRRWWRRWPRCTCKACRPGR
jgi:Transposase, Mutator family